MTTSGGRLLTTAIASCVLGLAALGPARAQMESREGIMLQNQILELRRDIQQLQQGRGGGYAPDYGRPPASGAGGGSDLQAQLLDRVQTLEDQVRRLRGALDEQTNQLRVAQDRLSKQMDDLTFRLGNAPGTPAAPPTPTAPGAPSQPPGPSSPGTPSATPNTPPGGPAQAAGPTRRPPQLALQDGNAALARRDYPAAEAAAREVLAGGRSPRTGDANFLLAQSLIGQRNYQGAAIAYDDAYNFSRTGPRAPDALLGLANALTGMSQRPAACTTLEKLRREFPSMRGPVRDTAGQLWTRNACT